MEDTDDLAQDESGQAPEAPVVRDPGLYLGMSDEDYHGSVGVSVSRLKLFSEAPAKVLAPRKETTALAFGKLAHTAVLEPELLEARFRVTKLTRFNPKEKAYKAELDAAARDGMALVKTADWDAAMRLRDAVQAHPTLRDMLAPEGRDVEASFYWRDPLTGLLCRGRADVLRNDWRAVIDVKTTESAHPDDFARKVAEYRYHWQQAHYEDGLAQAGWHAPEAFFFIAIEKEEPFLAGIYQLDPNALELGRRRVRDALNRWAECERTGIWPGYPELPQPLDLPRWAYLQEGVIL